MTIKQAAKKWKLSANWVRHLVLIGNVPSTHRTEPMPYYDIPNDTPKPKSLRPNPSADSVARDTRRRGTKATKVASKMKTKAKKAAGKSARKPKSAPAGAPANSPA